MTYLTAPAPPAAWLLNLLLKALPPSLSLPFPAPSPPFPSLSFPYLPLFVLETLDPELVTFGMVTEGLLRSQKTHSSVLKSSGLSHSSDLWTRSVKKGRGKQFCTPENK